MKVLIWVCTSCGARFWEKPMGLNGTCPVCMFSHEWTVEETEIKTALEPQKRTTEANRWSKNLK